MDDVKIALKGLLKAEEYEELNFLEEKPYKAPADFLLIIGLKNPPEGKMPFIHLYKDDIYYRGQLFNLDLTNGEKYPISTHIRAPGAVELMKNLIPTLQSVIQESLRLK